MKNTLNLLLLLLLPVIGWAQTTQTVKGTIIDDASRAPLPGVTVSVISNASLGSVTDENGFFKITNVPIGRQSFKVSYLGYEDKIISDVVVTAGKEVNLNLTLQESVKNLDEVNVTYNKSKDKTKTVNDMAQVSARSFNVDETKRYAGALGDPSRMASNFAGVAAGDDSRNDIVVRGNSPNGMLWQLEGLNMPNPNHFGALNSTGGPVSMLNNNNIDKSDFMTSAFPAQYGNALAGVFDIRLREGNKEKNEFVGQIGFNGFEAGAEGPLGKRKQTSYLINYRYSTLAVFKALGIEFGTGAATPIYQDLNYKIVSKLNAKSKLTLFGIIGNSRANFFGRDVDTTVLDLYGGDPHMNMRTKYGTTINGVSYDYQFSDKTSAKLTLGYSTTFEHYLQDSVNYESNTDRPSYESKFTTGKASALFTIYHKVNAKNNIQAGVIYDHTTFTLLNKDIHHDLSTKTYVDQGGSLSLTQAYAQWRHRFSNSLSAVLGVHSQYHSTSEAFAAGPRASLRYAANNRHAISIGYGLHYQTQSLYSYFVETPGVNGVVSTNRKLGFTQSHHVVLSYDWNITDAMRIKVEGYYQRLSNVPVEQRATAYSALNTGASFAPDNTDSLVNKGTGSNYGAEITIEHFFTKGYYFLVTSSLFDSKYKGSDGVERNTAFNTGYVLNILGGKEFRLGKKGSVLALNLKTTLIGGKYFTPIDLNASQQAGEAKYIDALAFSQKQQDYFRTDFKIAYRKEMRRSTLEVSLDLQNLTGRENLFSQSYDVHKNKIVNNYQQGFFPVPMVRYTF